MAGNHRFQIDIQRELMQFQQNVVKLQRMVDMMYRSKENSHPSSLHSQIDNITDQSNRIEQFLSENEPIDSDRTTRSRHEKLCKDFFNLHQQFIDVKEHGLRKMQVSNESRPQIMEQSNQQKDDRETKMRLQLAQQEKELNEQIMREREAEIIEIHRNVTEVNEVFKDLADIVNDQQREIDSVESMIEKSHQHAKSGLSHVEKANENQGGCAIS